MARRTGTGDYSSQLRLYQQYLEAKKQLLESFIDDSIELGKYFEKSSDEITRKGLKERSYLSEEALKFLKRTLDRFAQTTGDIFAEALVEGSVSVEKAMKSLAKSIISDLISSIIQLSYQQAITQKLQKLAIAQNVSEAASVWGLVAAYQALAAAKMAAFGFLPFFHAGGAVMHSGGEIRRAHSGLRTDEVGPFILQRGEYVMNKGAAREIGYGALDFMNRTGRFPATASPVQINLNLSVSAIDAKGVEQLTRKKIIPAIRRATELGIRAVNKRAIYE